MVISCQGYTVGETVDVKLFCFCGESDRQFCAIVGVWFVGMVSMRILGARSLTFLGAGVNVRSSIRRWRG